MNRRKEVRLVRRISAHKAQAERHPVWEIYFRSWVLPILWMIVGITAAVAGSRWVLAGMPTDDLIGAFRVVLGIFALGIVFSFLDWLFG